jgi:Fe2+ transport system protein FeoA
VYKEQNNAFDQVLNNTDTNIVKPDFSINLTQLKNGKSARVIKVQGDHQFIDRLEAMGILPDTTIVKKSASLMKGPIVIEKGEMQLAIGYEMAQKIMVKPID